MEEAPHDFFVSYTAADVAWAEWVAWQLKDAGHRVVFQRWDFRPGTNWPMAMHNAARTSRRTVVLLSPESLEAPYVQQEIAAALVDDPLGSKRKLIPIRIRDCSPGGLLKPIVYIDLVGMEEEQAKQALINGVADNVTIPAPASFPGARKTESVPFPGSADPQRAIGETAAAPPTPPARGAGGPLPELATLRRELMAAFDDAQFDAVCLDYFPTVFARFSKGMDRDTKTTMLLDHCRRTQSLAALRQAMTRGAG